VEFVSHRCYDILADNLAAFSGGAFGLSHDVSNIVDLKCVYV
jgi:hypothetical protein